MISLPATPAKNTTTPNVSASVDGGRRRRSGSALSNLERQGFKTVGEDRWKTTMGDPIRELIHFEMEAINPQLDVHPSESFSMQLFPQASTPR